MIKLSPSLFTVAMLVSTVAVAQDVVRMDDEPHYSRVFSNEYCRAYLVTLERLEEAKAVTHEHDWVRLTLGGTVEQAWNATVFGSAPYEDPEGYLASFLPPVSRVALRNPRSEPYRALIIEILHNDDSEYRWRDTSLNPFARTLGPGVDPHSSYLTTLTKTSVELMNVQLLGRDSQGIRTAAVGTLVVAMTDINLSRKSKDGVAQNVQLSKGDLRWFGGAESTFENLADAPARFVLLALK
jgi:hypothetical protein